MMKRLVNGEYGTIVRGGLRMGKIAKVQREKASESTSATPIAIRDAQLAVLDFLKTLVVKHFIAVHRE